jgi:CRP-like cAMP-binding protein
LKEAERLALVNMARRGTIIMEPVRGTDALYLLKEGRVRIYMISPEGKEFTLALLGPGNILARQETSLSGQRARTLKRSMIRDSV